MKNKTPLLAILVLGISLSLFFSSFSSKAVVANTTCLIRIETVTSKNINDAKATIESNPSAVILKYCASYQIFVIQYNPGATTPDAIIRSVMQTYPKMRCEEKDPSGFDQDAAGCTTLGPNNSNPN